MDDRPVGWVAWTDFGCTLLNRTTKFVRARFNGHSRTASLVDREVAEHPPRWNLVEGSPVGWDTDGQPLAEYRMIAQDVAMTEDEARAWVLEIG